MFKKIVSQLSFSPALVGQLGFYARRLRKEQATRRLGLVFVALALVVQSLVVFQAPEPANAANPGDMIPGGLGLGSARSFNNFLGPYDRNERHLKDIYNYFGISRAEITSTQFAQFTVGNKIGWGFENRAGARAVSITDGSYRPVTTLYGRPLNMSNPSNGKIWGYIGHSNKIGWFAIMQYCGNLITDIYPTPPTPPAPEPANIVSSKTGVNVTQNIDATKSTAKVNDKITYTVNVRNTGGTAKTVALTDNLSEVLKYAKLVNNGGGTLNSSSSVLSWPSVSVAPGASITKSYTVQMNPSLVSNADSCKMTNNFLTKSVTVKVNCTKPPANIVSSKTAINVSQKNVDASKVTARENNKITYTVTVKNTGGTAKSVVMSDDLKDVLTYSKLTDNGGGTLDATNKTLTWPAANVAPGSTITKKYTVQMNASLIAPSTVCRMKNDFMDKSVVVVVGCQTPPADIKTSKSATNVSQGNIDATKTTTKASDRITFTLVAENKGGTAKEFTFEDAVGDTLEYSQIIDNGGGVYNEKTRTLTWPKVTLAAGSKEVRTFTVKVLDQIPATPQGLSDETSYNCKIENSFYESYVILPVECPAPKVIEQVVPELPKTGPTENILFAGILFAIVTFFYLRSRQLGTEVRLIRRDVNGGTI